MASIPRRKPSEYTISPPNTAKVKIIGKPSHTAETDIRLRRACGGTATSSYSSPECRSRADSPAEIDRDVVGDVIGTPSPCPRQFPIGSATSYCPSKGVVKSLLTHYTD